MFPVKAKEKGHGFRSSLQTAFGAATAAAAAVSNIPKSSTIQLHWLKTLLLLLLFSARIAD